MWGGQSAVGTSVLSLSIQVHSHPLGEGWSGNGGQCARNSPCLPALRAVPPIVLFSSLTLPPSHSPPPLIADVNLFELLKRNSFHGLSLSLVKLFLRQLLDSLSVLRDASIIHCDLKVRGRGDAT